MTTTAFNDGWSVRDKTSIFESLQGAAETTPVTLPHDALIHRDRSADPGRTSHTGYFPSATVEYTKTIDIPEDYRDKRVTLELQGVHRDAMVYVNEVFAAQRPFGYSTFFVPLDAFLHYGAPNTIRVEARAHEDSRWYTGVGIHRDTLLHVTEFVHITPTGVQITTPDIDSRRAVVEIVTTVQNESTGTAQRTISTVLRDPEGHVVATDTAPLTLRAGAASVARQRLYVTTPQLWDVDSPSLYTAATTLADTGTSVEERETTFGIRTLQLDPVDGLRINGTTVKLRGACLHHDNGILGAATIGRAEERRVQLLKDAGFNAIRSSHNPLSQAMLDACDRHGMLVMDETFDMWTIGKSAFDYSLSFPEWWERDVEALVAKDFNHPSVIFYSIGNEIPETGNPLGSDWGRKIAEKIRSLDETRFITNSINGFVAAITDVARMMAAQREGEAPAGVNAAGDFMGAINASDMVTEKTAESFAAVDVAGINYGETRYVADRDAFPNRIIVGTETFPRNIDVNWRLVEENSHVIGDFTWTGWDYLGEVGIGRIQYLAEGEMPAFAAPYPWLAAWCGDLDITGFRRPMSYYRETVFGLRHEPYIAVRPPQHHDAQAFPSPWAWSEAVAGWTWDVRTGSPTTVEVYSDADEIELLLNGDSIGRAPTGRDHSYRTTFEVPYAPGQLTAVALTAGEEVSRASLRTAAGSARLQVLADRDHLVDDTSDLSFVTIEFRDADGTLITGADRAVRVEVSGAAVLQGLGSARPDPTEKYDADTHTTFQGRLLAIVRPTGVGPVSVQVTADGVEAATLSLDVAAAGAEPAHETVLDPAIGR
ncbi:MULTISPECIES: glycoside hydrolase family 2 TIM barrel-domain containing protein [unclassified Frigoribacterium]|uniref:glycoside hydrolase family 2 TIM barrel-domain containing protein n=1 Tax=unclassified Frigoribacterium TaxID=2627005 RepID=UPI0006F9B324|nr:MULTISPECIES: glycoside hydrolase family 2 TIM barrel-domain containing protein [unclassified Frigoribacterium]KQO48265.1 glycoside hydrolase [Frigoribacterium sp. Leaf254]KQT40358.1 glycoside hydrolase [Frigoribacterium sp. Leaf415]